jgi:hypothetical protein
VAKQNSDLVDDPTYSGSDAPAVSMYHPEQTRALIVARDSAQKLVDQLDAAIKLQPPAPVPAIDATPRNGTVVKDTASVYETPHVNAKSVEITQGAILTLVLDASRDEHFTWYKIVGGQYNGRYVKGNDLNMQAV